MMGPCVVRIPPSRAELAGFFTWWRVATRNYAMAGLAGTGSFVPDKLLTSAERAERLSVMERSGFSRRLASREHWRNAGGRIRYRGRVYGVHLCGARRE